MKRKGGLDVIQGTLYCNNVKMKKIGSLLIKRGGMTFTQSEYK